MLRRLTTIRGQLVLWYLGVLVILLAALGAFQWLTLNSYLRSSNAYSLRHAAYQELAILSPCFVRSAGSLRQNAQTLAGLLGGHGTAVLIVNPQGQPLASQGLGPPGNQRRLNLAPATVHQLIAQSTITQPGGPDRTHSTRCLQPPRPSQPHARGATRGHDQPPAASLISGGNLLLVVVPLGPPGHTVGYAILGRSIAAANATVTRMLVIFALGALAALLIAVLVALPIINRALRPLRRVANTAETIANGDLEQRAHLPLSPDEIGRLGEAFDTMVDRLQAAISEASASEERMRRFLADASHELRTPVTVLRGSSQVLLRQGIQGQPDLAAALRDMHEEAVRLARLVDDLLTLSRIDAGQRLAPRPVELRSFLQDFLDRYGAVWTPRAIKLDESRLDGTTASVDPEALRRVMTNLVDNAARYSRPDGTIRITAERRDHAVSIAVSDEGPGLRPEDAAHVFDRFYRANKSRSRNSGGTGLGLAIVRGLVEQSGGSISIDTGPDRGTTITVTLPCASPVARRRDRAEIVAASR